MCKTLLPLKLLVDADAWQNWGQNETFTLYFHTVDTKRGLEI